MGQITNQGTRRLPHFVYAKGCGLSVLFCVKEERIRPIMIAERSWRDRTSENCSCRSAAGSPRLRHTRSQRGKAAQRHKRVCDPPLELPKHWCDGLEPSNKAVTTVQPHNGVAEKLARPRGLWPRSQRVKSHFNSWGAFVASFFCLFALSVA
jgi:hypothetical protein